MEYGTAAQRRPGGVYSDRDGLDYNGDDDIGSSSFRVLLLAEMGPPGPRVEVVEGLLAVGEVLLLTGAPKAGKSVIAACLAASVSRGELFAGRSVEKGCVVYLALERSKVQRRRLAAAGADLDMVAALDDTTRQTLDLSDTEKMHDLATALARHQPVVIVIDTAAKAMPGLDENSSRDMGLVMEGVAVLQKRLPDAGIVLVHHLSKSGTGARGSGAILAAADIELRIERPNAGSPIRVATVTGANDVEDGQQMTFILEQIGDEIVARACNPSLRPANSPSRDAARDNRNASAKAEASVDAYALLDKINGDRFTRQQAIEAALDQSTAPAIKRDSVRKKVDRHLRRLVNDGALRLISGTYVRTGAGQAVG